MKKKGFTLIELLGVIILLGLIGLIVYPTMGKLIKDNKQKLYDKQLSELERITNTYVINNDSSYEDNVEKVITFEELKNSGLISINDIKNPITGNSLEGCMVYKWSDASNNFEIRYSEECVANNPESIDLEVTFGIDIIPNNGWYNENFYIDVNIEGASKYKWCGTTNSTCEPNSLTESNSGSILISTESDTNIICVIGYDKEGNYTEKVCSDAYKLDKTGPEITGLTDIIVEQRQTVDLTSGVNVSDSLSGSDGTYSVSPTSVDTSNVGEQIVTYTATDKAGNITTKTRKIIVTEKAPEQIELVTNFGSVTTSNENGWHKEDFYASIEIIGASSYKWCGTTNSTCDPSEEVNGNTGSALIDTESDSNIICIIGYDTYGNYTEKICSNPYKLDKTDPAFEGIENITIKRNETIDLRSGITATDSTSGIDGQYSISPSSIDTSKVGITSITYTVTDKAGNEVTETRTVMVEGNAPVLTFDSVTEANANGWYKNDFNVTVNVVDDSGLGINSTKWCETIEDSCIPQTSGTIATVTLESSNVKVCAEAIDGSGKSTTVCSSAYKLDKTEPYFSGIEDITIDKGTTFDVRNGVTVNDALSLVDEIFSVTPSSVDTSKAGTTTLTYTATDKAGNTKEITRTVIVDAEGPSISYEVTAEPNNNGWYSSTFFVNINVTDNSGTGIKETKWCGTLDDTCSPNTSGTIAQVSLEGSSTRICAETIDNNNKTSGVICSDAYKLDITKPSNPSITGGSNSYVTSASISLSSASTDTTSGEITYEYYLTSNSTIPTASTTATGSYTSPMEFNTNRAGDYIYVRAIDQAGNISEWSNAQRLYIDINNPTISAKGSSYTITEGDSNVISSTYFNIDKNGNASISSTTCTSSIDGTVSNTSSLSVGTHTVTCTVTKTTNKSTNASTKIVVSISEKTVDDIKNELVTTGDGLYRDPDGIYRYKGLNPNNYIKLGTELYRILAIENQGVKVIRDTPYENIYWDEGNSSVSPHNCTTSICPRYGGYCIARQNIYYYGCNAWTSAIKINQNGVSSTILNNGVNVNGQSVSGTVTQDSTIYKYLHNTYYSKLSSVQSYIVENATWNIGPIGTGEDVDIITSVIINSLDNVKSSEAKWTWNGKIGLISASEFYQGILPSSTYYSKCISELTNYCGYDNWINIDDMFWTINADKESDSTSLNVHNKGIHTFSPSAPNVGVRPVIYLKSTIKLSGSGTPEQPYIIVG